MLEYYVTFYFSGSKTFRVEAEGEDAALEKGEALMESFDLEHNLDRLEPESDSLVEEISER